ncbi:MAG: hypothetical protein LBM27_04660 [Lactobacillaceae bacterium]|jgi:hypothetical protein|nr:hypothetical protein [Lactobacillaceae bacterium]
MVDKKENEEIESTKKDSSQSKLTKGLIAGAAAGLILGTTGTLAVERIVDNNSPQQFQQQMGPGGNANGGQFGGGFPGGDRQGQTGRPDFNDSKNNKSDDSSDDSSSSSSSSK